MFDNDLDEEQLKRIGEISSVSGISIEQLLDYITKLNNVGNWNQRVSELWEESTQDDFYGTIGQLKKQIKYSKNPLEVKMLNRQLNQMYKEKKGVR